MAQSDVEGVAGGPIEVAPASNSKPLCNLRILMVDSMPFGTIGTTSIFSFAHGLVSRGAEVTFISPASTRKAPLASSRPGLNLRVLRGRSRWAWAKQVRTAVAEVKPHIVQVVFNRFAFFYPLLGRFRSPRHVYWLLDVRSPLLTVGWRRMLGKAAGLLEAGGYDAVLTHVIQSAKDVAPLFRPATYEVPLGVPFARVKSRVVPQDAVLHPRRFIYTGGLSKNRKLDILLAGIAHARRLTEIPFTVDFIGDGRHSQSLIAYAESIGLGGTVDFLGALPHDEIMERLANYDAGFAYVPLYPFRWAPMLKALEYMAANLFVLASDTEGAKLMIEQGRSGILFENNSHAIGEAIATAVEKGLPSSMLVAAREVAARFDFDKIIDTRLLPAYRAIGVTWK
ncbi:MAG TPA: glycosyltransferase family 4 protein [Rhizomicrobium sp.]|nr:glycosyltransferase family 4 protein [Rhizomicrobium sp.]